MKTYTQDTLAGLQQTRETHQARMAELLELKSDEARAFTDEERGEFDKAKGAIADLDDEIAVCSVHVKNIATVKPTAPIASRSSTKTPS